MEKEAPDRLPLLLEEGLRKGRPDLIGQWRREITRALLLSGNREEDLAWLAGLVETLACRLLDERAARTDGGAS